MTIDIIKKDYSKEEIKSKSNLKEAISSSLENGIITPEEAKGLQERFLDSSGKISLQARKEWIALNYELRTKFQESISATKDGAIGKETISGLKSKASLLSENEALSKSKTPLIVNKTETNEDNADYTLSKEDFQKYFEGEDFQQDNIGNCWLVATIDSLVSYGDYEDLIRKSVTKTNEGYKIIMPLGSPKGQGKEVEINKYDFQNQISINGTSFNLVKGKEGIKALMLAYGKISTGKDYFDVMTLEGGNLGNYFNSLVYGINSYSNTRDTTDSNISYINKESYTGEQSIKDYIGVESNYSKEVKNALYSFSNDGINLRFRVKINGIFKWLYISSVKINEHGKGKAIFYGGEEMDISNLINQSSSLRKENQDNKFINELKTALEGFDSKIDMLSVTINQGYSAYDKLYDYRNSIGGDVAGAHEISVEKTYKKDGKLYVVLSNTWDSNKSYEITFDELLKSCYAYTLGSKNKKDNLSSYTGNDNGIRVFSNDVKSGNLDKSGANDSLNLNQIIQVSGGLDENQSLSRGDVICRVENGKFFVHSWGKTDTYVIFNESYEPTINIGGKRLTLKKDTFGSIYNGKDDVNFSQFLYPQRLAVFINKLRHGYIDKNIYNGNNINPFYLGENGEIKLDDNPNNYSSKSDALKRKIAKIGGKNLDILENWSLLGIKSSDNESKIRIINFLNELCKSNNIA